MTDSESAWDSLLQIHAKLSPVFEREMRTSAGLSMAQLDAIRELEAAGSPLTMAQLADRVVLSRTRVSRLVDELVVVGFVVREANPDDGRSSLVQLTGAGRRRLSEALPTYRAVVDREMKRALSPAELGQLAQSLNAMRRNL